MAKKQFGEYFVGLDMGSTSVGWAASDLEYHLLKLNGKSMWGARLFDEALTAVDRRTARIARRRVERRSQRLALLQDLFREEVAKVDPAFFQRLSESSLHAEDRKLSGKGSLFGGDLSDADYHRKYPTIYHLRAELMESEHPHDVRLVYLALHHMLKYRGHFLFEGDSMERIMDLHQPLQALSDALRDELEVNFECLDAAALEAVLKDRSLKSTERQKQMMKLFAGEQRICKELAKALSGAKFKLANIFEDLEFQEGDTQDVCFSKGDYDEQAPNLQAQLEERYIILDRLHAIYSWSVLANILKGNASLSRAKVETYEKHRGDLARLKRVLRRHGTKELYDRLMSDPNEANNYCAYTGHAEKNGKRLPIASRCKQEDFCKAVSKAIAGFPAQDEDVAAIRAEIERGTFMPKIVSTENGAIPNQLHAMEMRAILKRASAYLPFLNARDERGQSVQEKVCQIMSFRIPYYVGPLNPASANSWVERRSREKIYPWNFDEIVDVETSAERFVTRMTACCTYLERAKVLPRYSILYSCFTVLNELNNLRVYGEPITVEMKQRIYHDLFENYRKVSRKRLMDWFKRNGHALEEGALSGVDGDFKGSLRPQIEMKKALGEMYTDARAETLIRIKTLFGDDRELMTRRARAACPELNEALLQRALSVQASGWGRISREFLLEIFHEDAHGRMNIMQALWTTNENLGKLLSERYSFSDVVRAWNGETLSSDLDYQRIHELYVSPSVKRQIWQSLKIVRELRKITGHDPKKIFIEMARSEDEKKERKESRRGKLIACYRNCRDDSRDWIAELESRDESAYRQDKLYLYYTQMGRCMYTGEVIDLNTLLTTNVYDIDHIYPRSLVKDDSLDNRVLVRKEVNADKRNGLLSEDIRSSQSAFWKMLHAKELISARKLERLMRRNPFTAEDFEGFIARQLVETRQSTKAAAQILKEAMPDTEIVYVKAGNVSEFRQQQAYEPRSSEAQRGENDDRQRMLKVRGLNDLHHAKDAYLNIVVGNVYNTRFTHSPAIYARDVAQGKERYNLREMYSRDVARGGCVAWRAGEDGSIATVRKTMKLNNVLVTKQPLERHGALFDLQPVKRGNGQLSLKKGMSIEDYGGYNNLKGAYSVLVEHTGKKGRVRTILPMLIHQKAALAGDPEATLKYLRETYNLVDPQIILPKIKFGETLEINGHRTTLTGRSGTQLLLCNAMELTVPYQMERYIKRIFRFNERAKEYAHFHNGEALTLRPLDGIFEQANLEVFDLFVQKLRGPLSGKYASISEKVLSGREKFIALMPEEQCVVLEQIMNMLSVSSRRMGDLQLIGLSKNTGILYANSTLNPADAVYLVHQSVTGLFETRDDLLHMEPRG